MKVQDKKNWEISFLALLLVQIGLVCYFNLQDIRTSLDADLSCTFFHFTEVLERETLMLPDWNHTTSLELDGSFLFALPLFFLTGNLFTAVGISNILLTVLYLFVIFLLLHHEGVERMYIYMTMALTISPFSFGMLDYFNMMFFGGSCYSVKTLVPLLLILLLSLVTKIRDTRWGRIQLVAVGVAYVYFLFATVFSTGAYALICGVAPVFVCLVLRALFLGRWQKECNRELAVVGAVTVGAAVAGLVLHGHFYPAAGRVMNVTRLGNHAANLNACIGGVFQLLGAVPGEEVPVLSVTGIVYCAKFALAAALLMALALTVKEKLLSVEASSQYEDFSASALSFLFLWNFLVLFLADARYPGNAHTEYRYLLMGVVPAILVLGMRLAEAGCGWNHFQKYTACAAMFAGCLVILYGNNKNVSEKWDRSTYAVEFCEYADTLDVDSVIFLDDKESFQFCRAIDSRKTYGAWLSDVQALHLSICDYTQAVNWEYYGENHALAVISGRVPADHLPAEMADRYQYIDSILWFDIYLRMPSKGYAGISG